MKIKTSVNEGVEHITLKKEVIKMLSKRKDVVVIKTEHPVKNKRGKYFSYADVFAQKDNGASIYVEVKANNPLGEAITQLRAKDKGNEGDEFIAICNFQRIDYFRRVLMDKNIELQRFINKTHIYTFDDKYNLKRRDVEFKEGKEVWIDGVMVTSAMSL